MVVPLARDLASLDLQNGRLTATPPRLKANVRRDAAGVEEMGGVVGGVAGCCT